MIEKLQTMEGQEDLRIVEHLETEYGTLISLLGDNFHSAVIRMAVQIERIAMVLSALRMASSSTDPDKRPDNILCSDTDYETAEIIGNRLLLHMSAAYRLIDGDAQDIVPDIKPLDQRRVLFNQLKPEYAHKELVSEAQSQGISPRTAFRWNEKWLREGLITKSEYGIYRKVG